MMVDLDAQKQDEWIKQFFPEQESQLDEWVDDIVHEMGICTALAKKKGANLLVDWVHWLMLQEWTKEQAAYLICEIDPNNDYFKKHPEPVTKIIQRCYVDVKTDQAQPFVWLRWFDKIGLLDVSGKLIAWYNEQLVEKELAGDLLLDDSLVQSADDLEPQVQVQKTKPRKKLKPFQRDTDYGSALIRKILKQYRVQYFDELKGKEAWELIVSGNYKNNDLIESISERNTYITLKDASKLEKHIFLDRYRKRFTTVKTNQQADNGR